MHATNTQSRIRRLISVGLLATIFAAGSLAGITETASARPSGFDMGRGLGAAPGGVKAATETHADSYYRGRIGFQSE